MASPNSGGVSVQDKYNTMRDEQCLAWAWAVGMAVLEGGITEAQEMRQIISDQFARKGHHVVL